ncbi:MMPL family transporter [Peribacillus sp. V2I11]|uniref:MMPL family transporter n=1 Tax=Peribacillus sp. V2I11 TaxID=3042277 RepID=UPI002782A6B9|nr:MMPL family transporter [Peribacillus sp. V2I11]MDQ0881556.1 putative membrane protein YdfJ with MMPL/SSD domain [Peribacillus sp. V2I11]
MDNCSNRINLHYSFVFRVALWFNGLITALGVLMDTYIMRPFLVPAITALLGRRAFWPSKVNNQEEKEHAN